MSSRSTKSRKPVETQAGTVGDTGGALLAGAPWRALCPRRVLELRDPSLVSLQRLPSGTPVALISDAPFSRSRLRRTARRAGVRIDRELIVVPTTRTPIALFDDTESAVRHFWSSVAAVPPGVARSGAAATLVLFLVRLLPWRCTGAVAPGRVLVGSRR